VRSWGRRLGSGQSESGAAAVEMALVLPILLVVVLGIIEFGFVFNAQISLTQAVREGVRVGSVGADPSVGDMEERMIEAYSALGSPLPEVDESTACTDGTPQASLTGQVDYTTLIGRFGPFTLRATAVMRCGG
jgi:Flp pilus assembly protein TadG